MALTDMPSAAPSRKVLASGAGGGFALLIGNLIVWALGEYVFGPEPVPQEVSAFVLGGLPILAGFAAAYFTPRSADEVMSPHRPGQHVRQIDVP